MVFEWESEDEKLLRYIKISPKKKMEWLGAMLQMMCKVWTKKQRDAHFQLREKRSIKADS
jgi:hypothetical protein